MKRATSSLLVRYGLLSAPWQYKVPGLAANDNKASAVSHLKKALAWLGLFMFMGLMAYYF
ncbi:MAG: hypothetical protein ACK5TR_00775 [Alphaproteobacteria bacterium]|jgi:hypothetical protein|nr:hypothetical protein [Alphaproteobacteria bacterium]